ncbi:hypothetical protein EV426DRAFT_579075 [Tirmania nivea]|nr:hypothetical protein EV426DRAFT_579075 [Tirmania nivea]
MPRTLERAQVLHDIDAVLVAAASSYLLASDEVEDQMEGDKMEEESDVEDILEVQDIIAAYRYISRDASTRRYEINVLDAYIHEYPETAFLALFRIHRTSFWQLVAILTQAGTAGYWDHRATEYGRSVRPIYQQIAVAVYMLGGGGGIGERTGIAFNIGYSSV